MQALDTNRGRLDDEFTRAPDITLFLLVAERERGHELTWGRSVVAADDHETGTGNGTRSGD